MDRWLTNRSARIALVVIFTAAQASPSYVVASDVTAPRHRSVSFAQEFTGSAPRLKAGEAGATRLNSPAPEAGADGAEDDLLGRRIVIEGTLAVVGAPGDDHFDGSGFHGAQGSAYVYELTDSGWVFRQKLVGSQGRPGDAFGSALALGNGNLVIGAPGAIHSEAGEKAYVFVFNGQQWVETQILQPDGVPDPNGDFGAAVAVSAGVIAVGSPFLTVASNFRQGGVQIFERSEGGTWRPTTTITASDGMQGAFFGASLSLSGSRLVIGAPDDAFDRGSAYVFDHAQGVWHQRHKLVPPPGPAGPDFGRVVAVSHGTILVSDPYRASGHVYVFGQEESSWQLLQQIPCPTNTDGAFAFGIDLAISDSTLVVGSRPLAAAAGRAFVFGREGTLWEHEAQLAAESARYSEFGSAVAIDGEVVLVGASDDSVGEHVRQGAIYAFERADAEWTLVERITAGSGASGNYFGKTVAIQGDTAVFGAPAENVNAHVNQGVVYVFQRVDGTWSMRQILTAEDGFRGAQFGFSVALDQDRLVIGAVSNGVSSGGGDPSGAVYVFERSEDLWTQVQKFLPSTPTGRDGFGVSVSISGNYFAVGAGLDCPFNARPRVVHVYARATSWSLQQVLAPAGGDVVADGFGCTVALSADTLLVGSPAYNSGTLILGAVDAFERSGGIWSHRQRITPVGAALGERFGSAVAIEGNSAVTISPGEAHIPGRRGAAYFFERTGSVWTQMQRLVPRDPERDSGFSESAAISGSMGVIGAIGSSAVYPGHEELAFVVEKRNGSWSHQQPLTFPQDRYRDGSGRAVAVSGDSVLLGRTYAPKLPPESDRNGAGYVFSLAAAADTLFHDGFGD